MKNLKTFTTGFVHALIITLLVGLYFKCDASTQTDYLDHYWNQGHYLDYEYYRTLNDLTQAFPEASLNEPYTPVLLFNDKEGYCVIPLNEQDRKNLNTQEILKQNSLDEAFDFKQMTNLEPCQPEIAQLVLNSIDKQTNQLAVAQAIVVGIPYLYIGACSAAEGHISNKRHEAVGHIFSDRVSSGESAARWMVGFVCFPVYVVGAFIRWGRGTNDGLVIQF